MRGRKPASAKAKLAKGETRPSRVNYQAPEAAAPDSIEPPEHLKGAGLRKWQHLAKRLVDRCHFTDTSMPLFEEWCFILTEIEETRKEKRQRGVDRADRLKLGRYLNQLLSISLRQQASLALPPAEREKVRTGKGQTVARAEDDAYFGGPRGIVAGKRA